MKFDKNTALAMAAAASYSIIIYAGGHWSGNRSVLDSTRLEAESKALYQLVTTRNIVPSADLLTAAKDICRDEVASARDTCMKSFLDDFGDVWVVNLVDGTRVLLRSENETEDTR